MSRNRKRKPIRRRGRRRGEAQRRRSQPGEYRPHWTRDLAASPPGHDPPPFQDEQEVPRDLLERAHQKRTLIQRFVQEGCPRGMLVVYAEQAAEAMNWAQEDMPAYTTLCGWVHRYRTWGILGLVDRVRRSPQSDVFTAIMRSWAIAAVVGGRLSYRRVKELLKSLLPDGARCPSVSTIRRWFKDYEVRNPKIRELAKLGPDGFRSRFRLAFPADTLPPGLRSAIDTSPGDLVVRVPDLTAETGWRLMRAFLTLVVDEGSRRLLTFNLSLWPVDSRVLLGVLRRVLVPGQNYPGLPTVSVPPEIRIDAGPEYLKGFWDTVKGLGIRPLVATTPEENARVERLFRSVKEGALGGLPGYMPTQRVESRYRKPGTGKGPRLTELRYEPVRLSIPEDMVRTLPELEAHLHAWALIYNQKPHSSLSTSDQALRSLKWIQQGLHGRHQGWKEESHV